MLSVKQVHSHSFSHSIAIDKTRSSADADNALDANEAVPNK